MNAQGQRDKAVRVALEYDTPRVHLTLAGIPLCDWRGGFEAYKDSDVVHLNDLCLDCAARFIGGGYHVWRW